MIFNNNEEQKNYVINKCKGIIDGLNKSDININSIDNLGWTATIRMKNVDLFFTYYSEDCWKIETFPVAMMSGSLKRSVQVF